jgi:Zn ribbon nucleic-acid-binding protein
MAIVHLVCPKCRHQDAYEKNELDTSTEITCSRCGFSELPTGFELAKRYEKKSWQIAKIGIIILAGIAFVLVGLPVIALAAFFVPIIIAAVVFVILYRRWKQKS